MMIEQQQQVEQKKLIYLQRVHQFFDDIKNWLKNEILYVEQQKIEIMEKFVGTYTVPTLSISSQTQEKLADIIPAGANIMVGEGRIDIEGWFGTEYIVYMRQDGPLLLKNIVGQDKPVKRPMYKGIESDNWYWVDNTRRRKVSLMNKVLLLELITMVSDYEFESSLIQFGEQINRPERV